MTTIFDSVQWLTSPTACWTIQYEYQRSGNNMQYRFYWKVWLKYSSSWYNTGLQLRLFINGVQNDVTVKSSGTDKGWSYEGTTGWYTVANKNTGTTPFYASLYDTDHGTTKTTSSTYSLAVSPTPATLTSAPNFDDESNPTIQYSNPGGNEVTSLQACISLTGAAADIAYRDIPKTGTSYTFSLTDAERDVLRNATTTGNTRTVKFYVVSLIDGAYYTASKDVTLSIVNAAPSFTSSKISYVDSDSAVVAISGNNQHIIQNKSTLTATIGTATGTKGATISKYSISFNGSTKSISAGGSVSFGTVNSSSDLEISVTVTDSRGNNTTAKKTVTIVPYSPPSVLATLERLNNYENTTYFTPKVTIASINDKNALSSLTYKYKQSGGSYGSSKSVTNNTRYTLTCSNQNSFVFSVTAKDKFETVTNEFILSKGRFPLFIDTEKNAVGVNEFPSSGEALRVAGGLACFEDGIVLKTSTKSFKITVNDSGTLVITQI